MAKMKVHVLDNGRSYYVPRYKVYGGPKDNMDQLMGIPTYTVLVEHPDGVVLFDAHEFFEYDHCAPQWDMNAGLFVQKTDENLIVRLMQLGYEPGDIDHVVVSHMHHDHTGWIHLFKNAQIHVPESDFILRAKNFLLGKDKDRREVLLWSQTDINWDLISEYKTELLDGITVYNYGPGHSGGSLTMLLELENDGNKLLIGDAVYNEKNNNPDATVYPIWMEDIPGYFSTMRDINKVAAEKNAEIWYGHDIEQFAELRKAPEAYYS